MQSKRYLLPFKLILLLGLLPLILGCEKEKMQPGEGTPCSEDLAPIVFVHGFLASGDTWNTQIQRFASNDLCANRFFVFDWNTLGGTDLDTKMNLFIDSVLQVTDADQIHLVGHSAGGGRCYTYLNDPVRAGKVLSYAHIGSNTQAGPAGPGGSVPTLNIYSTGDLVVAGDSIPGAANLVLADLDHYQVATSAQTFEAIYQFFYEKSPQITDIVATNKVTISGKCLTLAENNPSNGALVEVFKLLEDGSHASEAVATFSINQTGFWGPLDVDPTQLYVFKVTSATIPDFRPVIYYFEPFIRSQDQVYLRTFPPKNSFAGLLLSAIPESDEQSVISIFSSNQAIINGRDNLQMNEIVLSTPALASPEATMIALFCYDDKQDGMGAGEPIASFAAFPFLQGADIPISPATTQTWQVTLNDRTIPVLNWRSKSDGVAIVVFN